MSVLTYPSPNEEDIFKSCTKECGIITSTDDQQFFALTCNLCKEKFLYFDSFIGHVQTYHMVNEPDSDRNSPLNLLSDDEPEELNDADPALFVPKMEIKDDSSMDGENEDDDCIEIPDETDISSDLAAFCGEAISNLDVNLQNDEQQLMCDSLGSFDLLSNDLNDDSNGDEIEKVDLDDEPEISYDDLVEESLLGGETTTSTGITMHIKDRKMIQYLIENYRRNVFLWDHRHPHFRDRAKRANFICWMNREFKRRFNVVLAKDAVSRKWDNLRTVYKREINRMSVENTNISTLWYFNELKFLNNLYTHNKKPADTAVIRDPMFRRKTVNLWNDGSTSQMLTLLQCYPCFYDKFDPFYRSREKRGEALQEIANQLAKFFEVTTVQLSKRISQLRLEYAKQKQERFNCEGLNRVFQPTFTYYGQMYFMDLDIPPFKCEICSQIIQTPRELDSHMLTHPIDTSFFCKPCHVYLPNAATLKRHEEVHKYGDTVAKEVRYNCDLCIANFREKKNYEEHMRRHNDELLLPSLPPLSQNANDLSYTFTLDKPFVCDICDRSYSSQMKLTAHREKHQTDPYKIYKCEYPLCGKTYKVRQSLQEHVRQHYNDQEFRCDICGKTFKSAKNLQNHKQIHDTIKRYICKTCGAAFAQAAGLYLHKRRHNRDEFTGPIKIN